MMRSAAALLVAALLGASCVEEPPPPPPPPPPWQPGVVYGTPRAPTVRGLLDRRGIIHAHSVYSHDACDEAPALPDGTRDPVCLDDFRAGLCATRQDFVMLTDHADSFQDHEFPDVLLYREERGDELVVRADTPVASWAACDDGRRALVLAGSESGLMPVGLERHPVPLEERDELYGVQSAEAAATLRAAGAVVLVAHTEDFSAEQLVDLDVDGFEMFNMHANTLLNAGAALELVVRVNDGDPGLPYPDLVALTLLSEDERYLSTWGTALSSGRRFVTTMGSDCHRNTFTSLLEDGERVDSYRRAMGWFSNHLLVRPEDDGSYDDRHLKEALREGRLYGSFDVLGFPAGFDFHARAGDDVVEMGGQVDFSSSPELVVTPPRVQGLDPGAEPPAIVVKLLQARAGGFDEVKSVEMPAAGDADVRFEVTEPGAYRVEVRMIPYHLRAALHDDQYVVLERDYVWIYSNAIYVVAEGN